MDTCKILGVNIAVTDMSECINFFQENLDNLRGEYICVSNVHTTVMAYENEDYLKVQNTAVLRLPDGKPLSIVAKKRGFKNAERVTGPSFLNEILQISAAHQYKHIFYGSTQETLDKMRDKIIEKYPGVVNNSLFISPPFTPQAVLETAETLDKMNDFQADFIWVGLGAPKQEEWMFLHKKKLNAVCIGVGAAFDYLAGNIKRAPNWMQKISMEWLYRIFQSPKLIKRYWRTNNKFIWKAYFRNM